MSHAFSQSESKFKTATVVLLWFRRTGRFVQGRNRGLRWATFATPSMGMLKINELH